MSTAKLSNKLRILPIAPLFENWLETGDIDMSGWLQNSNKEIIIFDSVKIGSEFYKDLKSEVQRANIRFEFVVDIDELFLNTGAIKKEINEGIHFVFLIYKKVAVEILEILHEYLEFKNQFKFVIVARKDWSFENTYRSLPYFVRENLFIDFPPSIQSSDSFYGRVEIQSLKLRLNRYFNRDNNGEYFPLLKIHSQLNAEKINYWVDNNFYIEAEEPTRGEIKSHDDFFKEQYKKQELISAYYSLLDRAPQAALSVNLIVFKNHVFFMLSRAVEGAVNLLIACTWGLFFEYRQMTYEELTANIKKLILIDIKNFVFINIRHFILKNSWRFSPRSIGWYLFRFSFPIRKIYYFCKYQFESRLFKERVNFKKNEIKKL